ncbi:MAG: sel1 repeat family protein, partial [Pseudomonas sp.]|nr:sel1 repeat family protein [Pseudomonas sp.]
MPSPINLRHATTALLALALLAGCAGREPDSSAPEKQPQVEQPITQTEQDQLRQQAQRGDLESQFQLGSSYFVGQPEKNLKQAEYWWKQAADKGHAMVAVSLAYLYTGCDVLE